MSKNINDVKDYCLKLANINEIKMKDINDYSIWLEEKTDDFRTQNIEKIVEIFYIIVKGINQECNCEELAKSISAQFKYIKTIRNENINKENKFIIILNFLSSLFDNSEVEPRVIELICKKEIELLDDLKILFSLRIGNNLIFPINKLLVNIVNDFDNKLSNLMNLMLAIQLFKVISEENVEIEKKVNEIIATHNIRFLKVLWNHGELVNKNSWYENYEQNSIITVHSQVEGKLVVRSERIEYFENCGIIQKETNKNNDAIAYFIEINLSKETKLLDFDSLMVKLKGKELVRFLIGIFENEWFDVYNNAYFMSEHDEYFGVANAFIKNSNKILYQNSHKTSDAQSFCEFFLDSFPNVRHKVLYYDNYNIVTIDFLLNIFLCFDFYNFKDLNNYIEDNETEKTAFQNLIISFVRDKLYEKVTENNISKYLKFTKMMGENFDSYIDKVKLQSEPITNKKLIMPFQYPSVLSITDDQEKILFYFYEDIKKMEIINSSELIENDDYKYEDAEGNQISFNSISTEFVVKDTGKKVVSESSIELDMLLRNIKVNETISNCLIKFDEITNNISIFDKLKEFMITSDLDCTTKHNFGISSRNSNDYMDVFLAFKITSIMIAFSWGTDLKKICDFMELIKSHHCESMEEVKRRDFFNQIERKCENTIVIPKESMSSSSTFWNWHDKLYDSNARSLIRKKLSEGYIESNFSKENGTYKEHKVNEIVFVTDIVLSGSATSNFIRYYLYEDVTSPPHTDCLKLEELREYSIQNIPKIEYTILCFSITEYAKERIYAKFPNVNFKFEYICEIEDKYRAENFYRFAEEIFGESAVNKKDHGFCVLRYSHLPKYSIFPTCLKNTELICGLFNTKREL